MHSPASLPVRRTTLKVVAAILAVLLVAEVGLRGAGVLDFPTYTADDQIGYIPSPDQRGSFLNQYRWQVNSRSMGSGDWAPEGNADLLLLGDSLVWGGNTLDHSDKLGPQLQSQIPHMRVWSAGAGSWSVLNELAYLDRFPDVTNEADTIVWVLNSEDFNATPSKWSSDTTHPRDIPGSAVWFLARKWGGTRSTQTATEVDPVDVAGVSESAARRLQERLQLLVRSKRILVVLYPNLSETQALSPKYLAFKQALQSAMQGCCTWLEVREQADWKTTHYRDKIHPTASGNKVLSELIAQALSGNVPGRTTAAGAQP